MKLYADKTTVRVGKTQADLRRMIEKYSGQWVGVITDPEQVRQVDQLAFKLAGVPIRFEVLHPQRTDPEVKNAYNKEKAIQAEYRRRWREIWLIVKSRLVEATQMGRDIRKIFMPQLVTKTGQTIWEMSQQNVNNLLSGGSLKEMIALPEGEKNEDVQ